MWMYVKQTRKSAFRISRKQDWEETSPLSQSLNWSIIFSIFTFLCLHIVSMVMVGNQRGDYLTTQPVSQHQVSLQQQQVRPMSAIGHQRRTINPASHLSIITQHASSLPPSELDRPELSDGAPLLSGQSQTSLMVPWQGGLDSKLICLKSTQERDLYLLMVFFVSLTTREKSQ